MNVYVYAILIFSFIFSKCKKIKIITDPIWSNYLQTFIIVICGWLCFRSYAPSTQQKILVCIAFQD